MPLAGCCAAFSLVLQDSDKCCLEHAHGVSNPTHTLAGNGQHHCLKHSAAQLVPSELAIFDTWAGVHLGIDKLEDILMKTHPGTTYDYQLLYRQKLRAEKAARDGKSFGDMTDFVEEGMAIAASGGVFHTKVDHCQRMFATFRQTTNNRAHLQAYGQYLCLDGTHWVDRYGHVLIIGTVKDCLGITQNGFSLICPSEDLDLIIESVDRFNIPTGGTLHTDGAAWGPVLAERLGRAHMLCTNHYTTKWSSAAAGMGPLYYVFSETIHAFIYQHYKDGPTLDDAMNSAMIRCLPLPRVLPFCAGCPRCPRCPRCPVCPEIAVLAG